MRHVHEQGYTNPALAELRRTKPLIALEISIDEDGTAVARRRGKIYQQEGVLGELNARDMGDLSN